MLAAEPGRSSGTGQAVGSGDVGWSALSGCFYVMASAGLDKRNIRLQGPSGRARLCCVHVWNIKMGWR